MTWRYDTVRKFRKAYWQLSKQFGSAKESGPDCTAPQAIRKVSDLGHDDPVASMSDWKNLPPPLPGYTNYAGQRAGEGKKWSPPSGQDRSRRTQELLIWTGTRLVQGQCKRVRYG